MEKISSDFFTEGQILLIDKPLEWSSFQAVNALKWAIRKTFDLNKKFKIGHAGTLDPLATGLLLICTGKFTKKIPDLQGQVKEYTGTITVGGTTPSFDLETKVDQLYPIDHITESMITAAATHFIGKIKQFPPVYSALKKDGKRLYEYARKGEDVQIQPRTIEIFKFEITKIRMPEIEFKVLCSKGTYIRSLAHDFGQALHSGAHLSSLRRTKIGDFNVDNAQSPDEFKDWLNRRTNLLNSLE